ncbi:MAG: hypothetical protein HY055_15695 [Magnetospirillum sp.]|nr:hypothetical protein [Magnetospirillum sp.]
MSTTIMIIRHAEKPYGDHQGVTPKGNDDKDSLIVTGWQRAGALASLFDARLPLAETVLPVPAALYASDPEKLPNGDGSHSKRPLQTITPLADKLGLEVNLSFAKGEEAQLAATLAGLSGHVLVAWQHESILAIATPLMGSSTGLPTAWPDNRFDVVWVFQRTALGKPFTFRQVCQNLLAGDSNTPI